MNLDNSGHIKAARCNLQKFIGTVAHQKLVTPERKAPAFGRDAEFTLLFERFARVDKGLMRFPGEIIDFVAKHYGAFAKIAFLNAGGIQNFSVKRTAVQSRFSIQPCGFNHFFAVKREALRKMRLFVRNRIKDCRHNTGSLGVSRRENKNERRQPFKARVATNEVGHDRAEWLGLERSESPKTREIHISKKYKYF